MFFKYLKDLTLVSVSYISIISLSQALVLDVRYKQEYSQVPESTKLWYKNLHNSIGEWCCDESDGEAYYDSYDILPDGGVRLSDGTIVPPAQVVIDKANPTGHPVWFHIGKRTYCFVPGALN